MCVCDCDSIPQINIKNIIYLFIKMNADEWQREIEAEEREGVISKAFNIKNIVNFEYSFV